MKLMKTRPAIKVIQNTTKNPAEYGVIKRISTGATLHTGRIAYIRRVALKRYGVVVKS